MTGCIWYNMSHLLVPVNCDCDLVGGNRVRICSCWQVEIRISKGLKKNCHVVNRDN